MKLFKELALAGAIAIGVSASWNVAAAAEKISVAHSTWIGYGALYIAKEKGFFEKAGLDVDLQIIEASSDAIAAMQGGQINIVASTIDNFALFSGNGADLTIITALDESSGGDGIVAKKEIATVADLKGKSIGVQKGSVAQFLLTQALSKAGLSLDDVNAIDMKSGDAGAAFVAGSIDAAVTWQPWLSKAAGTDFGGILVDTSSMPGLIVDALAAKSDYASEHKSELKAFVDAYFEGIAYMEKNPAEAHEIIARNLKMSGETLAGTLNDVRFFTKQDNVAFFSGDRSPGFELVSQAGEFYHKLGVLRSAPDAAKLVGIAGELAK